MHPTAPASTGERRTHLANVRDYYLSPESRLTFAAVLGGTMHFGYYRPGDPGWRIRAAVRRMEDVLATALHLPAGSNVLDAGCGVGDVASRMASEHGLRVTGVDIVEHTIGAARRRALRRRLAESVQFRVMDYTDLSFDDNTFDGVYTVESLIHGDRLEDVLAEMYRVLRPGGCVALLEYSRQPAGDMDPETAAIYDTVVEEAALPGWARLDHGRMEQLLADAGFVDVSATDLSSNVLPMLRVCARIGAVPYSVARAVGHPSAVLNCMWAVEFYHRQEVWRYQLYRAVKPLDGRAIASVADAGTPGPGGTS